jgi:aspartate/methionine/tyrosine aminotransferase
MIIIVIFIYCSFTVSDLVNFKPTVWSVFGDLATKTLGSNLGQGFPDWNPPDFVLDSYRESAYLNCHQYTRPSGHPLLVERLGSRYSNHLNREINGYNEIAITVGASQALFLALTVFLKHNDEVVVFEPFFELYLKQIALTGATIKFVPLGGTEATLINPWAVDINKLKR